MPTLQNKYSKNIKRARSTAFHNPVSAFRRKADYSNEKATISILLTLCMVLTLLPAAALAATPGVTERTLHKVAKRSASGTTTPAESEAKPINREKMAILLVENVMMEIYGKWSVQFTLPGAFKGAGELRFDDIPQETGSYTDWFQVGRLLYWGIVPPGKFNPKAEVTYGEFTATLIKFMAYDKELIREGGGLDLIRARARKLHWNRQKTFAKKTYAGVKT